MTARRMVRAGIAGALVVGLGAIALPPAGAVAPSESHADSQFIDGTLLAGDLSNVVGIGGAHADYIDGQTAGGSVVDDANLDVTALNALNVQLPALTVSVGDLLDLGAVTQHAEAHPEGVSSSQTSTANLGLDLVPLLGANPAFTTADLQLGAVQSAASVDAQTGTLTRSTTIADATLNLQSPTVSDLTATTNQAVDTLDATLGGLEGPINTAVNGTLATIAGLLAPGGTAGSPTTTVTIDSTRLDQAVQNVLNNTLQTGLVTLDPATGTITVDLAGGIDLNNLDPNTTLLDAATLQQISADVATLLGQLQADLDQIITNALDFVDVTISSSAPVTVPLVGTSTVSIAYSGSLQDLIDGTTPATVTANGVLAPLLSPVLGAAQTAVQTAVAGVVTPVATTAVATAGSTIDTAVTDATNALQPALVALADVVQVNLNVQNASDGITSQADVTAVQVVLLPGADAVELNLATSSVGPNVFNAITPTIDAQDTPVPAGTDATVTGSGWFNDSTVTLQLVDSAGNPVGGPVTVTTDATGAFPAGTTIPVPAGTPEGTYTVRASDAAGNTATDTITVPDTTPPAIAITSPADGSSTNDTTPTITGTTEPGASVHVVVTDPAGDTVFEGDATVAPNGAWTIDSTALQPGDYTVTATATDAAGNTAEATSDFTVDTTAPAVAITSPADGSSTNDATPTVVGTTEAGATVHVVIRDDGGAIVFQGDAPVDGSGNWAIDSSNLPDGAYTVTATATDAAGNTATDTNAFTVDTASPVVDVVSPADGGTTNDTTPDVTGTVNEPAAAVDVVITDSTGAVVFSGPADVTATGSWTVDLAAAGVTLTDGTYAATATATDAAGNTDTDANTFTVDATAPALAIESPADGSSTSDTTPTVSGTTDGGPTVHVVITDDSGATVFAGDAPVTAGSWTIDSSNLPEGTYTVTATVSDGAGNQATDAVSFTVDTTDPDVAITSPADGASTDDTTPTIAGTVSEPGTTVYVVVTDDTGSTVFEGDATVTGTTWTIDSDTLPEGDYTVTATATDAAGNTGTDTSAFTVDTTPPAVAITSPADGTTTTDATPTVTGTTEAGATVHVAIAAPDGTVVFEGEATVTGTDWTIDSSQLPDGDYTVTATATDGAGNTADTTSDFTVDTAASVAITSPTDGASTGDTTPTITGTSEAGSTVHVVIVDDTGATVFEGDATVAGSGDWTIDSSALPEGAYTVTATATDAFGNEATDSVGFTVDTTAPGAPVITSPTDGSTISDTMPTISGTGESGATVTVTIDDQEVGTAVVDENGDWTVEVSTPLSPGSHTVTATQADQAGNTSHQAEAVHFAVAVAQPAGGAAGGSGSGQAGGAGGSGGGSGGGGLLADTGATRGLGLLGLLGLAAVAGGVLLVRQRRGKHAG